MKKYSYKYILIGSMGLSIGILSAQQSIYTQASRDVLSANADSWPSSGVTLNGTQFINLGLQGVGRIAANSTQTIGGVTETLGSISDMQITNWVKNGNGTFSGSFHFLPDRGYNAGTVFSNYSARINTFDFTFTPYTSSAPTTQQDQIGMTYTGASRFTYDHDANSGTPPILTTGLVANSAATNFLGQPVPTVTGSTTIGTDGPVANRLTLDSEGLILDHRAGKSGEGWIGDEYGAFVYHFNANKEIDGVVTIPAALVPHLPAGTTYFTDSPANLDGRRVNQGMEGIAISPDGTRLIAMLQSATLQDSGTGNQGRTNTRILVYDISSGVEVPTDPIAQYVLQLPRIDSDLNASLDRAGAQSGIVALDNNKILILSRDGNGRGPAVATGPVFKSILLADLSTGTNIDGTYDAAGVRVTTGVGSDTLLDTVTPVAWTQALNMLGKLDLPIAEVAKFGLNLLGNDGDANTISEKWEALSLVSAKDPANPNDYFLFVGNDNDFQTTTGTLIQADGASLAYTAGLENDTMVLAYRVRMVSNALAPTFNVAATAGLSATANNSSPINLFSAAAPSPAGGTFSGLGISGNTFDPAVVATGVHVITYSYTDSFGATQSASFNITVSAPASVVATAPTNALSVALKSSIILTDTGLVTGSGGAEIPAFHPASKRAYAASGVGVQVVDLTNPAAPVKLAPITPATLGLGSNDVSHVIVKGNVLALSLVNTTDKTLPGKVAFFNAADGTLLGSVTVGAVPDQLVFTPDGTKVLVANEGEMALASTNPAGGNPEGSVSIIDVSGGFVAPTVQTATFTSYNGQEASLLASGVRVFPGNTAAQDLEPEYIAIAPDGLTAMVTLQEANAVAILNIATATFTGINPLGLKNYSTLLADFSDRDSATNGQAIELKTGLPAFGMFMPDGISSYEVAGQTYYVTANEGDDRNDFLATPDVVTVNSGSYDLDNTTFPTEGTLGTGSVAGTGLKGNDQLGRLSVTNLPGLRGDLDNDGDIDRILSLGSRSFSILDSTGKRIFDSGDAIDRILTTYFPFLYDDGRSDNKSSEPEGVSISVIDGKTYAFIGLERSHSVMIFDVTNPASVTFTAMANRSGDLNPEGMLNISAADSPTGKPLLLVANEVSFTLTTYEVTPQSAPMQLQVLHYYGESGLLGIETAPIMGAMIDKFDNEYANTVVIGEGDSYIPGPWLVGGADPSLNRVIHTGTFTSAADTTAVPFAQADIAIMNAFGTTVSALGNHEFDLGSPVLASAIVAASSSTVGNWAGAKFPIITSNLNFANDSSLRGFSDNSLGGTVTNTYRGNEVSNINAKIAPYAVKTIGGQKIGFVGATTYDLLSKSSPNGTIPLDDANPATSDLQEAAAYIQSAVTALQGLGVNKIIMVDQLDELQRNKDLAPLVSGIDIMVAGGGHERMGDVNDVAAPFSGHDADFIADAYPIVTAGLDGKPTLIVTTDTEYAYLGRLVVDFDADGVLNVAALNNAINGGYASTEANLQAAYGTTNSAATIIAGSAIGTAVKAITSAINTVVVAKDGVVYGYTNVYLEGDRVFGRTQEVNLGNITADANALKARAALGLGIGNAVFSLKNGGGIRASLGSVLGNGTKVAPIANAITGKPSGGISQLDIENALRFDNKLMVFDTTPLGLKNILEYAAGLSSGPTVQNGGYAQVGNIRFSYNSALDSGSKLRSAALVNEAGDSLAKIVENGAVVATAPPVIKCVALSFTANGGDNYPIKYLNPPTNTIVNNETSNFQLLLTNGGLSAAVARNLDFTATSTYTSLGLTAADILGEQKAFQDFLAARHPSLATAYNAADTAVALDTRIQQLAFRTDNILSGPFTYSGYLTAGSTNTDSDGLSLLEEFAFGLNPAVNDSVGVIANIPAGTLTARGTPTIYSAATPVGRDFRYVFVRVKNAASVGITYTPEFSNDMTNGSWESRADLPVTVIASDGDYELVSVKYPLFSVGKKARFARLSISAP
jgi:2',3'-cyclic-nucleotide 2'-phosphodiesterase (5'-nucleotidase family)